jgi:hypothetical protein
MFISKTVRELPLLSSGLQIAWKDIQKALAGCFCIIIIIQKSLMETTCLVCPYYKRLSGHICNYGFVIYIHNNMTGPNIGMCQSKLQNSQLNWGWVCCTCSIIGPRGTKIEPKMTLCKKTDLLCLVPDLQALLSVVHCWIIEFNKLYITKLNGWVGLIHSLTKLNLRAESSSSKFENRAYWDL